MRRHGIDAVRLYLRIPLPTADGIDATELAALSGITRRSAERTLRLLEAAGLVESDRQSNNRRDAALWWRTTEPAALGMAAETQATESAA